MIDVKVVLEDGAKAPEYKTEEAAGADIYAFLKKPVIINPGDWALIPTGNRWGIPDGYEVQIRPRSGLAANNGVSVLNSPGTIDSDYLGEVKVILINNSKEFFKVNNGDRIAQAVIKPVPQMNFIKVDNLDKETSRDSAGFGTTGV